MMNAQTNVLKILPCSFTRYAKSSNEACKAQVDSHPPLTVEACVIPQANPCGISVTETGIPI